MKQNEYTTTHHKRRMKLGLGVRIEVCLGPSGLTLVVRFPQADA
jgi:hypothetical protein